MEEIYEKTADLKGGDLGLFGNLPILFFAHLESSRICNPWIGYLFRVFSTTKYINEYIYIR